MQEGRRREIGGSIIETPDLPAIRVRRLAWNKGPFVGQKRPLKSKHVWPIRVRSGGRLWKRPTYAAMFYFSLSLRKSIITRVFCGR